MKDVIGRTQEQSSSPAGSNQVVQKEVMNQDHVSGKKYEENSFKGCAVSRKVAEKSDEKSSGVG
jgi:hypothetical protein